ncbi:MAG: hypothetical protein ACPIOQ_28960, partial [Promethearchaeia archaeon]
DISLEVRTVHSDLGRLHHVWHVVEHQNTENHRAENVEDRGHAANPVAKFVEVIQVFKEKLRRKDILNGNAEKHHRETHDAM